MTPSKTTVVISGACGFIGRHLAAHLTDSNIKVVPVSRRSVPGIHEVFDYADTPAGDVLVHLAEEPDREKVNRLSESAVCDFARVLKALAGRFHRIIYASSAAVYGDEHEGACTPDTPVVSVDAYTSSKLRNEHLVLQAGGTVARISNLFGRGMPNNNVISDIFRQIPGDGPIWVRDEKPIRDFLAVTDAACALSRLTAIPYSGILNVGSGVGTSIRTLAEFALAAAAEEHREVISTAPAPRRSINVLDITQTTRLLGWSPTPSLQTQLAGLLEGKKLAKRWTNAG